MAYEVLARKWRPATFAEMVGQEHVLRALSNALDQGRLHHAYLFTGTRGVGKTTVARILARCLNCEQGVSATPCGTCSACVEVSEGRSVDLIEVDAASRTRVDDTRELLDNVQYAPTRNRYKVYLIDEVHMLSNHSFNALLKTLEEPPPHVKFLLATTDPQKLPATVLSRCLQFNLKNMGPERIVAHLQHVLRAEGIPAEEPALWLLARAAAGSMRDALSLTDQAIGFSGDALREADVQAMLGTVDRSRIHALLERLLEDDTAGMIAVVGEMAEQGVDFHAACEELIAALHALAMIQALPQAPLRDGGDAARVRALAARCTAEDVQLCYQMALDGRRDLSLAPDARSGFEMLLLRMVAFRPMPALVEELPGPPSQDGQPSAGSAGAAQSIADARADSVRPAPAAEAAPDIARAQETPAAEVGPGAKKSEPTPSAALDWCDVQPRLQLSGSTQVIASHCQWLGREGGTVHLRLDPAQSNLFNARHCETIRSALRAQLGEPELELDIEVAPLSGETPAAHRQRILSEQRAVALQRVQQDSRVQALLARFSGSVDAEALELLDAAASPALREQGARG